MRPTHSTCPVCGSAEFVPTVQRARIPAMQNRVFRTSVDALAAKTGELDLELCAACGFAFNNRFDSGLLEYDQDYDNSIPSIVVADYYRQIAEYLHRQYLPSSEAVVVEVGCGKGAFLKSLCGMFPNVRGIGIDPSYTGPLEDAQHNVRFVRDVFRAEQLSDRPDLIVCRHVLEHIPQPVEFLRALAEPVQQFDSVPIFVEVPDLNWILRAEAFWDFCYEHCNYFTPASLSLAGQRAGFHPVRLATGFGQQYLWLEAVTTRQAEPLALACDQELATELRRYCTEESDRVARMKRLLLSWKSQGQRVVVWGMATKGILFSTLVDPESQLIDLCIDVNPNKQGGFVPGTGRRISSPEQLVEGPGTARPVIVLVMNPNYLKEIQACCRSLGVTGRFLDAQGELLPDSRALVGLN